MSDLGDVTGVGLFRSDFWCNHKMRPFWEKIQGSLTKVYLGFAVVFGITFVTSSPACLERNAPDESHLLTDTQATFVSNYCTLHIPWYLNSARIRLIISLAGLYVLLLSGLTYYRRIIASGITVYLDAERMFSSLNCPLKKVESFMINPNLDVRGDSVLIEDLRNICKFLYKSDPKLTIELMHRREILLLVNFVATTLVSTGVTLAAELIAIFHPIFTCSLGGGLNISVQNSTEFSCVLPRLDYDWLITGFYNATLVIHCFVRFYGLYKMRSVSKHVWLNHSIKQEMATLEFRNARYCMLVLNDLCLTGREQTDFGKFVDFIFSSKILDAMEHHICSTSATADLEYVQLVASVKGKDYSLKEKSGEVLKKLIKGRHWESIAILLNTFNQPFTDIAPLSGINFDETDSKGCSLLYYALSMEYGCEDKCVAPMRIRDRIPPGKERIVCCNGKKVKAIDFIESQYENDWRYPYETMKSIIDPYANMSVDDLIRDEMLDNPLFCRVSDDQV